MDRYETESRNPYYMNSQWYEALNREQGRVQSELSSLLKRLDFEELESEYLNKVNEDDFGGQFTANFDVGQLTELTNAAYNEYLINPTEANKAYAEELAYLLKTYTENNEAALNDDGAVFPWLSKSAAGYLPQLGHQLEYGVGYSLVGGGTGAIAGSVIPGIGTVSGTMAGLKSGYVYGVGKHSFEQVRGSVFRTMIEAGIDEETARAAAMDEALVSALIEASEAGVDVLTLGLNGLLGKIGNAAGRKAVALLGKYGINLLSESAEEGKQELVSYANLDRVKNGTYDPNANIVDRTLDLAFDSGKTFLDAVSGKNSDARKQI